MTVVLQQPVLDSKIMVGEYVKLLPFDYHKDKEYLFKIGREYQYFLYDRPGGLESFITFSRYVWVVYSQDVRVGIVMLSYYQQKDMWTLSGFGDKEALRKIGKHARLRREATQLVMNIAFKHTSMLYCFHYVRNMMLPKVLIKQLGFNFCETFETPEGTYSMYLKRRN